MICVGATIALAGVLPIPRAAAEVAPMQITIDLSAPMHPIDPAIYGVSFATAEVLRDLNLPLNRSGGNSASTYNWREDARGTGADFYFESVPVTDAITDQFGHGFVAASRRGGAEPMITVPMIGWAAKLGPDRTKLAAFSIARYGAQKAADHVFFPDAGNGIRPDGTPVIADPADAAIAVAPGDATARVADLVSRWGQADAGGVRYYLVDNEPSIWHLSHRDVRMEGVHAADLAARVTETAAAIRQADPGARIVAPEEWGWGGYLDSGFDQQAKAASRHDVVLDRTAETGGLDHLPWLLSRWRAAGYPVDVVSVHYYPQGGEYGSDAAGSREIQLLRNRSTRSLWDPAYRDKSWIAAQVALIPRLRTWVDTYYRPGTPIAVTEYNWGGEASMSGATAQADIWGIFGRERLDMAARWQAPKPGTPTYLAMRLIRNYDGRGGAFGDVSLKAVAPDPDVLSAFAARRTRDGAVTVLVVNKDLDAAHTVHIDARGLPAAHATVYRLAAGALSPPASVPVRAGAIVDDVPAQSVALYVLPSGTS